MQGGGKKKVLALEFWTPPQLVLTHVSADLLVLVAKLVGIPTTRPPALFGVQGGSLRLPMASGSQGGNQDVPREAQRLNFPTVAWKSPDFHDFSLQMTQLETSKYKTRVGFGRTKASVRLDCIVVCSLSFGHGSRNPGFQGFCKGWNLMLSCTFLVPNRACTMRFWRFLGLVK